MCDHNMLKAGLERYRIHSGNSVRISGILLSVLLLLIVAVLSTFIGPVHISIPTVLRIYLSQLPFLGAAFHLGISSSDYGIVVFLREPQIVGGIIVGASLGIGGAVVQSIFRNPITEPYIIGVSSGASLGAVGAIVLGLTVFGFFTVPVMAFVSSVFIVLLVYVFTLRGGRLSPTYLLLTGIAVSLFVSSIVALLLFTNIRLEGSAFFWLLGSLSGITWSELLPVSIVVLLSTAIMSMYHRELDALQMGEMHARSVGVSVERVKKMMIILVTLSVSAVVSISGIIGFVGLIVPHVSRLLYGGTNRYVLPSSAILGALFLVVANDIATTAVAGEVIPIGVVTGIIGVPVFMYLLRKLSGGSYGN